MENINTLKEFYNAINSTIDIRKKITSLHLRSKPIAEDFISSLKTTLRELKAIPQVDGKSRVKIAEEKTIDLDLSYEIGELEKDLLFIENGEESFLEHLDELHPNFNQQVSEGVSKFKDISFNALISDRDGTVNNYCGRYASSVQSIYNAVFLSRFAQKCTNNSVILTSAPLMNIGLADISVAPINTFIYAGSKGREYINQEGTRCNFPIEESKQEKLDEFNKQIGNLLKEPEYEKYGLIGSGLQFKFGQTTIARQDISKTIPAEESSQFLEEIKRIISLIDPEKQLFRIEDTGLDVEVILTIEGEGSEELKDFDKGDGVKFLNNDAQLNLSKGHSLICGDTNSDVPMIPASLELSQKTSVIFVSQKQELQDKVKGIYPEALLIDQPDILVAIFNQLASL